MSTVEINVIWDTDGEPNPTPNPVSVPSEVIDTDTVEDYLSDKYSYMIKDWRKTVDWTEAGNTVAYLLSFIDDERHAGRTTFRPHRMTIEPDRHNENTLKVSAFDEASKPYKYAMYVRGSHIETDGY